MSRRDTIIVAVLINAALLLVLFATAGRSGDQVPKELPTPSHLVETSLPPTVPSKNAKEDLLNQYITATPTKVEAEGSERVILDLPSLAIVPTPAETVVKAPPSPPAVSSSSTSSSAEASYITITVKKGDALEKIARSNNTTVAAIQKVNQLPSTHQLKVGQVLKIPTKEGNKPNLPLSPSKSEEENFYVVKEGDNPWLIASKNHIKLDDLLQMNGLDAEKARRLRPGDRLRIR